MECLYKARGGCESTWAWNTCMAFLLSLFGTMLGKMKWGIEIAPRKYVTHVLWSDNVYLIAQNVGEFLKMLEFHSRRLKTLQ